jgi:ribokinase
MENQGVLVIGSANMDLVVTTNRFPVPGETVFGNRFQMFPGGKGANQAVSSAKLGGKTTFIGKLGDDQFCRELIETMRKDGVNLEHIFIDSKENTGVAFIIVSSDGQNEIVVISGSNMKLTPEEIRSRELLFRDNGIVLCQLEIPLETVMESAYLAKKNNCLFILNPAPARELPDELITLTDYITPNEIELEFISGIKVHDEKSIIDAALSLIKKGLKNIIVTMGSKGALLINDEEKTHFPARKVDVVDTTAAGDAFNGAIAYSLSHGSSIHHAIKFANIVAAISVTRLGAQSSMPVIEEIKKMQVSS